MKLQFIVLTHVEWKILCSHGRIRVLHARCQSIGDGENVYDDFCRLIECAPQSNKLGDSYAYVVAQIIHLFNLSTELSSWIHLHEIEAFFPMTSQDTEDLERESSSLATFPVIRPAQFEILWNRWIQEQTAESKNFVAANLLKVIGCGQYVSQIRDQLVSSECEGEQSPNTLLGRLAKDMSLILNDDSARDTEGTWAHPLACATFWARHINPRSTPAEDSELQLRFVSRLKTYRESAFPGNEEYAYPGYGYLTTAFVGELNQLTVEAPLAFDDYLTPASIGVICRFLPAIKYGAKPTSLDLVTSLLRLQFVSTELSMASAAYLIGRELRQQFLSPIVVALENMDFRAYDVNLVKQRVGISSLNELRLLVSQNPVDGEYLEVAPIV